MEKCFKVISLFKELLDIIDSLSELEYQTLKAGLQLVDFYETQEKIKELAESGKQN